MVGAVDVNYLLMSTAIDDEGTVPVSRKLASAAPAIWVLGQVVTKFSDTTHQASSAQGRLLNRSRQHGDSLDDIYWDKPLPGRQDTILKKTIFDTRCNTAEDRRNGMKKY